MHLKSGLIREMAFGGSGLIRGGTDEIAKQLEEETLEMSQVVWDNDGKGDEEKPGPRY
jgi:hypothetical protein